jgi:hypothetical protein
MAKRPMPPTVTHDATLEAQAMRSVHGTRDGLGMDVVKDDDQILEAHIVSDFHVVQNELGIPVKRVVAITLVVKKASGQCEWDNVVFSQEHMGGGNYGGLHGEGLNDRSGIVCPDAAPATGPAAPDATGAVATPAAPAGPAAPSPEAKGSTPPPAADPSTTTKGLEPAQIDAAVDSLGPKADANCKAYVREVCSRQRGPQSLPACQHYATSLGALASSAQGPTVCKSMLDGLKKQPTGN